MSVPEGDLQTKKTEKYDRQLRLWGVEGQQRIEDTHICVLNGGPVGAETLKNLVLPGIGEFTIIDGNTVTNRDLGNNFFVELSSVGKSRAEEVTRLLYELNDMVKNKHFIKTNPEELISKNPDFVANYTVIVATEISPASVLALSAACQKHKKILLVARVNGLIGSLRIQAGEHVIVQSKPSFPQPDLRINSPFDALYQFSRKINYEELDDMHFAHVPFPLVLLKEVEFWKSKHDGRLPETEADKTAFKTQILNRKRKNDNENFDEAIQKAHFAWKPYEIESTTLAILEDPKSKNTTAESSNFWLLANAVKSFVDNEGQGKLPLMGTIPDMTADTQSFIELQYIYRNKSQEDVEIVKKYLGENLSRLGLPKDKVPEEEIKTFCKNVMVLQVIRYSTLLDEQDPQKIDKDNVSMHFFDFMAGDDTPGDGLWYMTLRAADRFHMEHGRYPGEKCESHTLDFPALRKYADEIMVAHDFEASLLKDAYLEEICRFGNSQIHNIAAIIGGICAQEVIKLVTGQWVPLENTYIFNGINATSVGIKV